MDEEIKKICEGYAQAWYFDHPHRLEWQHRYYRKYHGLSDDDRTAMTEYFCKCQNKNEELLPQIDYVGPFESYLIKRESNNV